MNANPQTPVSCSLTLILGGVRSGKSDYAEQLARASGRRVVYIATATDGDEEMRERIQKHRMSRQADWVTIEAPKEVAANLRSYPQPLEVVVLDCVTLLISNLLCELPENAPASLILEKVAVEVEGLLETVCQSGGQWLIVSNEVGMGVVPAYPLGRTYRDALGWANQRLAAAANRVVLMVAGIPVLIKGS